MITATVVRIWLWLLGLGNLINQLITNILMSRYKIFNFIIALVWLINGLFSKVLNLTPRHEQIVARILGNDYSELLTKAIGVSEILMTIWIIIGYKSKLNALSQMLIITVMNIIEFILAPDLLLFGRMNALFAGIFIIFIAINEFVWHHKPAN